MSREAKGDRGRGGRGRSASPTYVSPKEVEAPRGFEDEAVREHAAAVHEEPQTQFKAWDASDTLSNLFYQHYKDSGDEEVSYQPQGAVVTVCSTQVEFHEKVMEKLHAK